MVFTSGGGNSGVFTPRTIISHRGGGGGVVTPGRVMGGGIVTAGGGAMGVFNLGGVLMSGRGALYSWLGDYLPPEGN